MSEVTLQLNLSAGDIDYAKLTVPSIVAAHRSSVAEVLAIVDCCRPQRTKYVDPDVKFPVDKFRERVAKICNIAEELRRAGCVDRVYYLEPGDSLIRRMAVKYLVGKKRWLLPLAEQTHDSGACGYMSYIAGLELPKTRYVVHYDADMMVYVAPGYDWVRDAIHWMQLHPKAVAATPRVSPPFASQLQSGDGPSRHEGLGYFPVDGGWRQPWFSTRCYLMDIQRIERYLPLFDATTTLDVMARWAARRSLPRSFECLLFRTIGRPSIGCWRLGLSSEEAWLIHPTAKPREFLDVLPEALDAISQGDVPTGQRGYTEFKINAWREHLALNRVGDEMLGRRSDIARVTAS